MPSDMEDVKNNEALPEDTGEKTSKDEQVKVVPLAELISERKKRQEYERKLKEIEEAENLKKGEYEKVLADYKTELVSLQQMLAEKQTYADKWLEYEKKQREQYKSILGDIPNADSLTLEQLEFLANKLKTKVPDVSTDVPNPKSVTVDTPLTEEQKKEALQKFVGWSEKEAYKAYAEILSKIKKK